MTIQELAQQILDIAQKALEQEKRVAIYIDDDPGICDARAGLEAIIKLCQEMPPAQEAFKQYEKKEVSHERTAVPLTNEELVEREKLLKRLAEEEQKIKEVSHAKTSTGRSTIP